MHKLGKIIGNSIDGKTVIFLSGDLGAGKTTLTKYIAEKIGINDYITSPTFNIIKEYRGDRELIHMDLYRLGCFEELMELGLNEYLEKDAVIIIEWPEMLKENMDIDYIEINIRNKFANDERQLIFKGKGDLLKKIREELTGNDNFRD